uniref:Uncharacterized protein n=1 Tax=Trichobilharzia regenti TaxID=157069 RepID=A0AA85JJ32_TRIRE|nr:unnamed protein product [Trichobilharzia regenti]
MMLAKSLSLLLFVGVITITFCQTRVESSPVKDTMLIPRPTEAATIPPKNSPDLLDTLGGLCKLINFFTIIIQMLLLYQFTVYCFVVGDLIKPPQPKPAPKPAGTPTPTTAPKTAEGAQNPTGKTPDLLDTLGGLCKLINFFTIIIQMLLLYQFTVYCFVVGDLIKPPQPKPAPSSPTTTSTSAPTTGKNSNNHLTYDFAV